MQALGVYFDIVQATQTPKFWGLSILVWGVILFTVFAISVIAQLWHHIHETENAYHHALSLDEDMYTDWEDKTLTLGLIFSNAINKPIGYEFIADKTYIEIKDTPRVFLQSGGYDVIPIGKSNTILLPEIALPEHYPCDGILHYELVYGYPDKALFKQVREQSLKIKLFLSPHKEIKVVGESKFYKDEPIKKRDFDKGDYRTG